MICLDQFNMVFSDCTLVSAIDAGIDLFLDFTDIIVNRLTERFFLLSRKNLLLVFAICFSSITGILH